MRLLTLTMVSALALISAGTVLAADAAFAHVLSGRTAVVARVTPYGQASSSASSRRCTPSWTI